MSTTARKVYFLGGKNCLLPFRANGYYVEDARGNNIAECQDAAIARAITETLNNQAGVTK